MDGYRRHFLPMLVEPILITLAAALLGGAFLFVFYRAVQLNWPESYFGSTEFAAFEISASPLRYAAFRFGPVFLTALFAAVATERSGGDGAMTGLGVGAIHAVLSTGRAILQSLTWPRDTRRNRRAILLVWIVVFSGTVLVGGLASLTRRVLGPIVPPLSDVSSTLWTGLIAGVLGAFIVRISRGRPIDEDDMIRRSRLRIDNDLWREAAEEALARDVDVDLVRAVMLVEDLQRPGWFRRLERTKGAFVPRGTYGIMQVSSDRPITDSESIKEAVARMVGVRVKDRSRSLDTELLEAFARTYNPNRDFLQLLQSAYHFATQEYERTFKSPTGVGLYQKVIEVSVFERLGSKVRVEGSVTRESDPLVLEVLRQGEVVARATTTAFEPGDVRSFWMGAVDLPSGSDTLVVREARQGREELRIPLSQSDLTIVRN